MENGVIRLERTQRKFNLELNTIGNTPNFTLLRRIPRGFQKVPLKIHNVLFPRVFDREVLSENFVQPLLGLLFGRGTEIHELPEGI